MFRNESSWGAACCREDVWGYAPNPLVVAGYSNEQIGFHVYLMIQAGMLEGSDCTHFQSESPEAMATSLTWAGYEFLEASRDESSWIKAKSIAATAKSMTLDLLKTVLAQLTAAAAKKVMGLT